MSVLHSFLWLKNNPLMFTPLSVDRHLGCFYFLAVMNNAALKICVRVFVWMPVFNSFGCNWRVALLCHMETLCLTLKETGKLISNMATSLHIWPKSNVCVSISSYPHQHLLDFIIVIIVDMNWYIIVVSIYSSLVLRIFLCAYWLFTYILRRNVYFDKKKSAHF